MRTTHRCCGAGDSLEGLNERAVAPDPAAVARLAELDIPLPDHPSEAGVERSLQAMICVARELA